MSCTWYQRQITFLTCHKHWNESFVVEKEARSVFCWRAESRRKWKVEGRTDKMFSTELNKTIFASRKEEEKVLLIRSCRGIDVAFSSNGVYDGNEQKKCFLSVFAQNLLIFLIFFRFPSYLRRLFDRFSVPISYFGQGFVTFWLLL